MIRRIVETAYKTTKQLFPTAMAIAAFAVSLISLSNSKHTQAFVARKEALNLEFELYRQLATMEHDNPLLSHLFAVSPAGYLGRRKLIETGIAGMPASERAKLLLQERAIALYIFTAYEETYFHWDSAVKNNDKDLAGLLLDNLVAFNESLCNSRLLWYWSKSEDALRLGFSSELNAYYDRTVAKKCNLTPDPQGPITLSAS